jgi:hypothetical protein
MSFYDQIYASILDSARRYGAKNPEVLARLGAAQSTLETGGGKHLGSGNNYFGIKGGDGPAIGTQEVINGRTVNIKDHFRSYPSMQASADDYVKFVHQHKNYAGVINANTPQEAIRAQAHSGYATDPRYFQKLTSIHDRNANTQTATTDPNAQLGRTSPQTSSGTVQPQQQVPLPPQRGDGLNRLMNRSGPAAVDSAPATPQQIADPKMQVMNYAQSEPPKGSALNQINPLDPSGPLLKQPGGPAPVTTPSATPQQIAQPQFANTLKGLGLSNLEGVTQAPRQSNIMNNFPMNINGSRDMMGETPYAVQMAGMPLTPSVSSAPITPLSSAPAIQLPIPETQPLPQVTNGTGGTPIAAPGGDSPDVSGGGASPAAEPGPTTPDSGSGGMGGMMDGLASALESFAGGGGEGGGGGQQQPQVDPTGGLGAMAAIPDFPSAAAMPQQMIAQKSMQVSQPQLMEGPLFQLKPIGQQGPQPAPVEFSDAHSATKRLFGRA